MIRKDNMLCIWLEARYNLSGEDRISMFASNCDSKLPLQAIRRIPCFADTTSLFGKIRRRHF
jgi:hypothetical protein